MNCLRVLGTCALVLLARPPTVAASPGPGAAADPTIDRGADSARVRRNRFLPWRSVEEGARMPADAELECARLCRIRTPDGTTITLDPGARITMGQLTYVPSREGGPAALGRRVELREGAVQVAVANDPKRPRTAVVGTPQGATIVARPGIVRVNTLGATGVACLDGAARVKLGSETVELKAGQGTVLDTEDGHLVAHNLIEPPAWRHRRESPKEGKPLGLSLNGSPAPLGIAWERATDASAFRVELARDASFADLVELASIPAAQTYYVSTPVGAGTYFVRIRTLAAGGLESVPSSPAQLRVIGIRGPAGAAVDGASPSIAVAPGATLSLDDNAGLDIALDESGYHSAPQTLRADQDPHTVHLRTGGELGSHVSFRIIPRGLRAAIRLAPAWALWPDHPVDVTVRIEDPTGTVEPSTVSPKFEVLLGVDPLAVHWTKEGDLYRAHIPPRDGDRPVVLRVIATDESGAFLGRNFLEIERRRPRVVITPPEWATPNPSAHLGR